ncbi:MAG: HNH endonuclease [Pseudomonadota bacterium]
MRKIATAAAAANDVFQTLHDQSYLNQPSVNMLVKLQELDLRTGVAAYRYNLHLESACPGLNAACVRLQTAADTDRKLIDALTVIGDVKAFADAIKSGDALGIAAAIVGIAPVVGDALGTALKAGKLKDLSRSDFDNLPEVAGLDKATRDRAYVEYVVRGGQTASDAFYSARAWRENYEAFYGAGNVTSTTVPPYSMPNVRMANNHVTLLSGRRIVFDSRGFPVFDDVAKFDTRLSVETFRQASYREQMKMATLDIAVRYRNGEIPSSAFSEVQWQAINAGNQKIPGYTWHHHQDTGRMQLVPTDIHSAVGHTGAAIHRGR